MNKTQKRTLDRLFQRPIRSDIDWADVESLLKSLGATIEEGSGSRVRVELNGRRAVFHRPHPERRMDKGAVKALCEFLEHTGVNENGECL